MRFNLGEVWKSVEGNGVSRRPVVVDADDDFISNTARKTGFFGQSSLRQAKSAGG
jgi:hypothetical protein